MRVPFFETSSEQIFEHNIEYNIDEDVFFSIDSEDGGKVVRQESMPMYEEVEEVDLAPNWIEDIFKCSNFSKDTFLIIWSYAGISETQFWEFDIEDIPKVCSERALFYLIYATPDILHIYNWRRLYRLGEHGSSMVTFFEAASQTQESLLLVKTRTGSVIGAFFTNSLLPSPRFSGSGKNFIFYLDNDTVNIYHASFEEHQYQRCTNDSIVIGGPTPCIYLSGNFSRGTSSGKGRTFKNRRPLTPKPDFEILDVELWAPSFD